MFYIKKSKDKYGTTYNIVLTRGDTFVCTVEPKVKSTGEPYTPEQGDEIRFAMKQDYSDTEPLIEKVIPTNTCILQLDPLDTKELPFGDYVYDIQITMAASGYVDTFIRGEMTLAEEVE